MKSLKKSLSVAVAVFLLSGLSMSLHGQIKVFDNGSVGIKYTATTPLSKLVYNSAGTSEFEAYFYAGNRSSSGGAFKTVVATGTGSVNHIYGVVGQGETGANNYLYGVRGGVWSTTPLSAGRAYGVYGLAGNTTGGYNYGVYGALYGSNNGTAVYGTITGDVSISGKYAGYFNGDVYITGLMSTNTITVRGSDEKLKTNIASLESSGVYDKIAFLHPATYNLRQREIVSADSSSVTYLYDTNSELFRKKKYGFVAQEMQEVFPDLVYTGQDGTLGIDYIGLIPIMIQAIQEQQKKIRELESILNELTKKFENLPSPK